MEKKKQWFVTTGGVVTVIVGTDAALITLKNGREVEGGDMGEIVPTAEAGHIVEAEIDPTADLDPILGIDTVPKEEVVAEEVTLILVHTHAVDQEIGVTEAVREGATLPAATRDHGVGAGTGRGIERKKRRKRKREKSIKSGEIGHIPGAEVVVEVEADQGLPRRTKKNRSKIQMSATKCPKTIITMLILAKAPDVVKVKVLTEVLAEVEAEARVGNFYLFTATCFPSCSQLRWF